MGFNIWRSLQLILFCILEQLPGLHVEGHGQILWGVELVPVAGFGEFPEKCVALPISMESPVIAPGKNKYTPKVMSNKVKTKSKLSLTFFIKVFIEY